MKSQEVSRRVVAMLAVSLLLGPLSLAQHEHLSPQEAPIKLTTDLVSLNVMVTDQTGRAIPGLKKEDLKVYEDRVEQRQKVDSANLVTGDRGFKRQRRLRDDGGAVQSAGAAGGRCHCVWSLARASRTAETKAMRRIESGGIEIVADATNLIW